MKKKGISLIVLVITIVVIIILAAAVILSLGKNNPINDAKKAKIAQTVDNFKSDLAIQVADKLLKEPMITIDEIDSNETLEGFKITDLIPSIKGTEYEDDFIVENGKLKLKEGTTLPEETQNIIKEYLGEKVEDGNATTPEDPTEPETPTLEIYTITYNLDGGSATNPTTYTVEDEITLAVPTKEGYIFAGWTGSNGTTAQKTVTITKGSTGAKEYTATWRPEIVTGNVIKSNPSYYMGATVQYSGYSENTNNITWRIFNVTDSGVIQLIANDYVDLTYKGETPATGITVNGYAIYSSTDRGTLINYLTTQSNWSEYAVNGKTTAVGAPTIEEFCNSYKFSYPDNYVVAKKVLEGEIYNGTNSSNSDGYVVKLSTEEDTEYWDSKAIGINDDLYIKTGTSYGSNTMHGVLMGSVSGPYANSLMGLDYLGRVCRTSYRNVNRGARPLVSLTSSAKIVDVDGVLKVE